MHVNATIKGIGKLMTTNEMQDNCIFQTSRLKNIGLDNQTFGE